MKNTPINPQGIKQPLSKYSHAVEVKKNARYLYVSGQIPETPEGEIPIGFEAQCRTVWDNILAVLKAGGMGVEHLVKVNFYLTHPDQTLPNRKIREQVLGNVKPALTAVIVQTLQPGWLLEIDAVAAAEE